MTTVATRDSDNPFLSPSDPRKDFFPYETIDFSTRLEVLDRKWTAVRYTRRQLVRFKDDGVSTFLDFVWGDGVQFVTYSAHSMRIMEAVPTRNGYVVLLKLPRPFYAGEVFEVVIERKITGAFFDERNYWESMPRTPTERLSIEVVAPRGAGFRAPEVILPPRHEFAASARGRTFQFHIDRPPAHSRYRLTWLKK
ncbi:MAG: hypothetical protein ACREMY_01045 [bacterium]